MRVATGPCATSLVSGFRLIFSSIGGALAILAMASMALLAFLQDGRWSAIPLALLGIAQAGMNMAIWALLALSVQSQSSTRTRLEALPVGLFLAVLKCASGLGGSTIAALVGGFSAWSYVAVGAVALPMIGCIAILTLLRQSRSVALHSTR